MIDTEDQTAYSFKYTDCEGKTYGATFEQPGPTWMEALDDYVRFLESIYKYDIRSKVRIEEPIYLEAVKAEEPSYIDPWTGKYFSKEVELPDEFWWDEE
jgi:hypothetical protein